MLYKNLIITEDFLNKNPNSYFVFGDNLERFGYGGAAALRDHPRAYGFITKKFPDNKSSSFYEPNEYAPVFFEELNKLINLIDKNKNKIFYISKIGSDLANKYRIWETLIHHNLIDKLKNYKNVILCWEEEKLSIKNNF
jgi:hypothetical protein